MLKDMRRFNLILFFLLGTILPNCKKSAENIVFKQPSIGRGFVTSRPGLVLRDSANRKGKALRTIPAGTELQLFEKSQNKEPIDYFDAFWYRVEFESQIGWVYGGYLFQIPINETITVKGIFEDTYPEGVQPTLVLLSNNRFWLRANGCEYLPEIEGKFSTQGSELKFVPERPKDVVSAIPFTMKVEKDQGLILVSEFNLTDGRPGWITCAPNQNSRFRRLH